MSTSANPAGIDPSQNEAHLRVGTGSRLDRSLAGLLIVLSALPFAAVPMGTNTHLPLSSVVSALLVVRFWRVRAVWMAAILIATAPFFGAFFRMFVDASPWRPVESLTWAVFTLPFAGTAVAVIVLGARFLDWLSWTLLLSALFVVVQKHIFIDMLNVVPFVSLYELPGYWTPTEELDVFLSYNRRPFGLFPEPSFMAGSLSLMAMALVMLTVAMGRRLKARDMCVLVAVVWAVYISGSGSSVIILGAVVVAGLVPWMRHRPWFVATALPLSLLAALVIGLTVVTDRQTGFNYSWIDRYTSIAASWEYFSRNPVVFCTGLGRGGTNEAFLAGTITFDRHQHYTALPDIYSVLGRVVLENGVIVGLTLCVALALFVARAGGQIPWWLGLCSLSVWLVIGGLTTSYDSAYWIWGLPGVGVGILLLSSDALSHAVGSSLSGPAPVQHAMSSRGSRSS